VLTPILTASPLAQITRLGAAHAAALPTRPAAHIGGYMRGWRRLLDHIV
jgi:hypothetical protein